ncbi:MAG: hypothetical protein MUE95_10920 [Cyclobacteriaceae bacterium]|nr:hypothetical protein [Cyclobacteriaceae bacterium]
MRKQFVFLVLVFAGCGSSLYAQKGFLPGFVVLHNQDTLTGLVKDRKDYPFTRKYEKIRFKRGSLFVHKYSAEMIKAYRYSNLDYESVWLDQKRERFREKFYSRTGEGKQLFLQRSIQSKYLSYYMLEYVDQDSGVIDEVPLFKRPGDDYFIRVSQGILGLKKKLLADYFSDCPVLAQRIQQGEFHAAGEIIQAYSSCR